MRLLLAAMTILVSTSAFARPSGQYINCDIQNRHREDFDSVSVDISILTETPNKAELQYIAADDERANRENTSVKYIGNSLYLTGAKGEHMLFLKRNGSQWWEGTLSFKHYSGAVEKVGVNCRDSLY